MADFVQDGVYEANWLIGDNFMQDIYGEPYIEELLSTLRSRGDIEEFIRQKDEKRRADFISFDASILANKKSIKYYESQSVEAVHKISLLEEQKRTADVLKEKIERVTAAYPDNRRENLTKALSAYASFGDVPDYLQSQLKKTPTGFFDKLKSGKKIENANKEFAELMQYCKDNQIYETQKSSGNYLYATVLKGKDTSAHIEKLNQEIEVLSERSGRFKADIQEFEEAIKIRIEDYDNSPNSINNRKTENDNIRSFAKEKAPYITNPPTISKEEIATHGLSEEFIEGQIMQSSYPGHARASLRRFYEGLDRPAAPMVAFAGADIPDEQGRLSQDDVLERLKAKGFVAVKATDERAKDPTVFIVDKCAVHSPFMAPDEALKTNIQILEVLHESPYVDRNYLSNPLTREAFVPAIDNNFKSMLNAPQSLNVENIIKQNGCNYNVILSDYYKQMTNGDAYSNLCNFASVLKQKNQPLFAQIGGDINKSISETKSSGKISSEDYDNIGRSILQKYNKELSPYLLDSYLQQMVKEAFTDGISPEILDENLRHLEQTGILKSVYHGGSSSNPYAVLCAEENMCFVYGAGAGRPAKFVNNGREQGPDAAIGYAIGKSSHNARPIKAGSIQYGFLCEYESREDRQEFTGIDRCGDLHSWSGGKFDAKYLDCSHDETAILPHQNKLKKMYVVTQGIGKEGYLEKRILPLELDENGVVKDKRWRDFCELHNPVDDNLKGYMIERRNNMIADYDAVGKEKMMFRSPSIAKAGEKAVEKTVAYAGTEAVKSSDGIVSALAKADNAVNQAIDKTIDKGGELLNNNAVGRAYEKVTEKVADTKVVKAVEKTTAKAVEKAANTAVGKAVTKTVAKAAGSAVGKSVIKKIPLVSAVAGCYFAWDRIKEGDWKGACGEVASGVAGCLPGLGTGISAAIDVGLAAKDIKTAIDENKQPVAESVANTGEERTATVEKTEEDKKKMRDIILQKQGRLQAEQHHPLQQQAAQQNNFNLQQRAVQQGRG